MGGPAFTASTAALPVLAPDALAAVVHTSGATGPAKPVRYTHAALAAQRDTILGQFPIGAFTTSFAPFMLVGPALGLACGLPDDVTPGALDFDAFALASAAAGTTTAWLSPAAAQRIVDTAAGRTAPMELVMLAGAPVLPALAEGMATVTGADVRAPYGMTEALPLTDGTTPSAAGPHGGTCTGHPLAGVEVVIDELEPGTGWGEILVSAAWMRAGYDRRWAMNRDATTVIDGRPLPPHRRRRLPRRRRPPVPARPADARRSPPPPARSRASCPSSRSSPAPAAPSQPWVSGRPAPRCWSWWSTPTPPSASPTSPPPRPCGPPAPRPWPPCSWAGCPSTCATAPRSTAFVLAADATSLLAGR